MKKFCPLASGSKGNSIFVSSNEAKILIDAGISAKQLEEKLNQIGETIKNIDAILITHEHTDHIAGLRVLALRYGIPIIANHETAKGIVQYIGDCPKFKIFSTGETFQYLDIEIHPFTIQHDTLDPVAFTLKIDNLKIGVCADLGHVTSCVRNNLTECDYLYIESNHEISMVHASSRPMIYKQRVLGRTGHLSNVACAELLREVACDKLKQVYLAHLSSECNTHEVALMRIKSILEEAGINLNLTVAPQDTVSLALNF